MNIEELEKEFKQWRRHKKRNNEPIPLYLQKQVSCVLFSGVPCSEIYHRLGVCYSKMHEFKKRFAVDNEHEGEQSITVLKIGDSGLKNLLQQPQPSLQEFKNGPLIIFELPQGVKISVFQNTEEALKTIMNCLFVSYKEGVPCCK